MKLQIIKILLKYTAGWAAVFSFFLACTNTPYTADGGGTRGGNPVVMGAIVDPDGSMARNARVLLIAQDYNPLIDSVKQYITYATTDSVGAFSIEAPDTGWYNLEATGTDDGTRLIRFKIKTELDSVTVLPTDTLHKTGSVKVVLPTDSELIDAYVYVPGTTIVNRITGSSDTISIDSVPAGVLPVLCLGKKNSTKEIVISHDIPVVSSDTTVIQNWEWSFSKQIILNTSSSGAGTKENVYNFPVLIRLTSKNFDFSQTQNSGKDIKFTSSNDVPLAHEIEKWDSVNKTAAIWVKVDTVYGNNSVQSITMYWGNPDAEEVSNSASVFDTAYGYQAVWHFSDKAGSTINDATVNNYTGISPDTAKPLVAQGVAGECRVFNGINNYFQINNTANSKLNFPENGNFTISVWVFVDSFDTLPHVIVAKGYEQFFMRYTGISSKSPLWEFAQLGQNGTWQACSTSAKQEQWTLVTAVRQGSKQSLYCNGALVDSTADVFASASFVRNTSSDVSIGRYLKAVNDKDGYCFFKGYIDEVRMISMAQSADWVLLSYMNQRSDDRLVVFK